MHKSMSLKYEPSSKVDPTAKDNVEAGDLVALGVSKVDSWLS